MSPLAKLRAIFTLKPTRNEEGRFISTHRMEVIEKARAMRAAMPDRDWKVSL